MPHKAEKAIDGLYNRNANGGRLAVTKEEVNPWWKLDLKKSYKIMYVIIDFRLDCCANRMMGWLLRVGDIESTYGNRICAYINEEHGLLSKIYVCEFGIRRGRYVYVVRHTNKEIVLSLSEVRVIVLNQDL